MPNAPDSTTLRAPTISVIVPSWRRPADLARCLDALGAQSRAPLEVIVGARVGDDETAAVVAAFKGPVPVRLAGTPEAGVVAAMNAALALCGGEVVALTDDDAEPRADWIERLGACFADREVGAAGGRDWQPTERGNRTDVGRVQWFGRVIGNHHLGSGPARDVDVLKGVNIAVRAALLRERGFDRRLRGGGAQMFWELSLCLWLRRQGWRLVYDPAIAVEHHIGERHDADQRHRGIFAAEPQVDAVHNETLVLLEHLGWPARLAFLLWAFGVGTRIEPGMLQIPRLLIRGEGHAFAKWVATARGRLAGWSAWRTGLEARAT